MSFNPASGDTGQAGSKPSQQKVEIMTLLFTDMVGSTRLKEELGNEEAVNLIQKHHVLIRQLIREFPEAFEVDNAGDAFFIAFKRASDAVCFALQMQSRLRQWNRHNSRKLADRVGIHVGEVIVETDQQTAQAKALRGLEVDKCARVMSLGQANHILLTRFAFDNARGMLRGHHIEGVSEVRWVSHGHYSFKGVAEPVEVCEVAEVGITSLEPPPDSEKAQRLESELASEVDLSETGRDGRGLERFTVGRRFNRKMAMWGGIIAALAGALALILPFAWPLTNGSYDLAYLFRPTEVPEEAVIVRMDRESHDQLGQPWMQPWDKRVHAALIEKLMEFKARAVVFDVLFDRQSKELSEDAALVSAAKRFGKVAVAGFLNPDVRNGEVVGYRIEGPFPELRDVARWGLAYKPGLDLTARQPLIGTAEKQTLAAEVAQMIGVVPRPVPAGSLWLNHYGPPRTIESFSYSEILTNHIPPARFANKIAFVGAVYDIGYTAGRGTDEFKTPYSLWMGRPAPGVEIIATAALNLIRGDGLRRLSPWAELGMVLCFGMVAGYGLCTLRPLAGATLAGVVSLVLAWLAMTSVWQTHVWFPWMVVCLVQVPVAVGWSALALTTSLMEVDGARRRPGPRNQPGPGKPLPERKDAPSPPASTELIGAPAVPNFKLLHQIGSGAYGEVWLARDAIGLYRAVKVVHRRSFGDATPYDREFEGIRRFTPVSLLHAGLVQVLHVGRDDAKGYFYYVMELGDDERRGQEIEPEQYSPRTLEGDLHKRRHLRVHEVVELGMALGDALHFLHQHRLVHRDIKPANILYVRGQPKLGDIGLVTTMADPGRTVSFLGTKGYMAPEGPGHAAADIYGLGKLLYVAAMGRGPSEFPDLPADLEERPDRVALLKLNKVLLKACEPDVELRYRGVEELLGALRELELKPT